MQAPLAVRVIPKKMLDDSPAASPAYLAAYVAANSAVTAPTAQAGATVYALPAGPQ